MSSLDDRRRRAGWREAQLRRVNERVVDSLAADQNPPELVHVVCECARDVCEENLLVPRRRFDDIRGAVAHFVVAEGHVIHDVEHEVDRGDGWVVVRKVGVAADAAEERP